MGMETMHLIQTPPATDLMTMSDSDIEAFFATAGLDVDVVVHCNTVGCSLCFAAATARAA
jgi:hypothetical protein